MVTSAASKVTCCTHTGFLQRSDLAKTASHKDPPASSNCCLWHLVLAAEETTSKCLARILICYIQMRKLSCSAALQGTLLEFPRSNCDRRRMYAVWWGLKYPPDLTTDCYRDVSLELSFYMWSRYMWYFVLCQTEHNKLLAVTKIGEVFYFFDIKIGEAQIKQSYDSFVWDWLNLIILYVYIGYQWCQWGEKRESIHISRIQSKQADVRRIKRIIGVSIPDWSNKKSP